MSQIVLNLRSQGLDNNNIKTFIINKKNNVNHIDFLKKSIRREVAKKDRRKLKRYKKICRKSIATFLTAFFLTKNTAMANTVTTKELEELKGVPEEIFQIGMILIGICVTISTILAIILTQLAGGYRMLQRREEATEWTSDIIRGYTQILLAPVIIIIISLITLLLFKDFDWFITPL